jgi:hypothetical protein
LLVSLSLVVLRRTYGRHLHLVCIQHIACVTVAILGHGVGSLPLHVFAVLVTAGTGPCVC